MARLAGVVCRPGDDPAGGEQTSGSVGSDHTGKTLAGSEMLKGVSEGWPAILTCLKTLLKTGEPLPAEGPEKVSDATVNL